jgi:hypothetical protein
MAFLFAWTVFRDAGRLFIDRGASLPIPVRLRRHPGWVRGTVSAA